MSLRLPVAGWVGLLSTLLAGFVAAGALLGPSSPPGPPAEVEFALAEPTAPPEVVTESEVGPLAVAAESDAAPLDVLDSGAHEAPPTPAPAPTAPAAEPTAVVAWRGLSNVNYLLMGLDRRGNELARADVIIMGNVDLRYKRASLLSIPRDLIVSIPGRGRDRISSAFAYGELDQRNGGGAALLRRVVEQNFGVRIDHYAVLDFNCFRTVVDAVGGVDVDVRQRIVDPYYPTEDYRYRTIVFEQGRQHLNGARALEYVRTRYTSNDFSRMHRQQQVLSAIRSQLLSVSTLPSLPTIVSSCGGLSTDLNILDVIGLAGAGGEIKSEDVSFQVIEPPMVTDVVTSLGAMMLQPRWELIRPVVQRAFPGATAAGDAGIMAP